MAAMEHVTLGTSGLHVSVAALGTMTFGAEADEAESHRMLDRFVEAGGSLVDTADVYTSGLSEEIIGRWIVRRGGTEGLVVATKGRFAMGPGPNDRGSSRHHLQRAVEASLRRLCVDAIDLYQLHAWDPATPLEETLGALDDMVRAGRIRYIGVSNFTGWQLQQAILVTGYEGLAPVVSLQPQYNLLAREIEWEILPQCLDEGIAVLPWSPLGGGWLTGKYQRDEMPSGTTRLGENPSRGVEGYAGRNVERTWAIVDAVHEIAIAHAVPAGQVAINWLAGRPGVTSVILGARTEAQLAENLGAWDWELAGDERRRLDEVSAPGIPTYPYGFLEKYAGYAVWEELTTRVGPPAIGD
jgi:aryl-alcohol dehydrogenase-like predicted oxidoreductase